MIESTLINIKPGKIYRLFDREGFVIGGGYLSNYTQCRISRGANEVTQNRQRKTGNPSGIMIHNPKVGGSIPPPATNILFNSQ